MRKTVLSALLAGIIAAPALAGQRVELQSAVFIERIGQTADGRIERRIEPANILKRGDRLVLIVEWEGKPSNARSFAVTSSIPRTLAFQRTSEAGTEVSVDGGRHWGTLDRLKLNDRNGVRAASPEDVTHLRWHITSDEAERGIGRVTYSAIVR